MNYWHNFQSLLGQLAHEDDLLAARTMWLMTAAPLLIIAGALAGSVQSDERKALPWIGLALSIVTYASILASLVVYLDIRRRLQQLGLEHPDLPMRRLPSAGAGPGLLAPVALALTFCAYWTFKITRNKICAIALTASAFLFGLFVVSKDSESGAGDLNLIVHGALALAIAALALAILTAVGALRSGSRREGASDERPGHR